MTTTDPRRETQGVHVLIVEDSLVQAQALRITLEAHGYCVDLAADGTEGLGRVRAQPPAVVISDVEMPLMDGYEFCRTLKADPALRSIPVILLTSHTEPEDIFRGLEVKADSYLTKPYDAEVLFSRIAHVLANRDLRNRQRRSSSKGVEVIYSRRRHRLDNDREQILELLMSSLDDAMRGHAKLEDRVHELEEERRQLRDEIARLRAGEA